MLTVCTPNPVVVAKPTSVTPRGVEPLMSPVRRTHDRVTALVVRVGAGRAAGGVPPVRVWRGVPGGRRYRVGDRTRRASRPASQWMLRHAMGVEALAGGVAALAVVALAVGAVTVVVGTRLAATNVTGHDADDRCGPAWAAAW